MDTERRKKEEKKKKKKKKIVSNILLDIEAVKISHEGFILTSGVHSPTYIDCRRLISFPEERRRLIRIAAETVREDIGSENIDVIAGGETAGIPFSAWLSEELDLPMVYVRKKKKTHGSRSQVEGILKEGDRVLLFEDLIFDGRSKVEFMRGIEEKGAFMKYCLVIFDYGRKDAENLLRSHGVELHRLTDWNTMLEVISERRYFSKEEIETIRSFLADFSS